MKKFWEINKYVVLLLVVWRLLLFLIEKYSPVFIPLQRGYNGPTPWANFDGIYYLHIAEFGYFHLSEAFFPFYPMLIGAIARIIPFPYRDIASALSLMCVAIGILIIHTALHAENKTKAWWTVVFFLTFPTSFFYSAAYPTGLFFLLSMLIVVCARKKQWFWCGVFGAMASATRIFGVIFLVYVGLEYFYSKPKKIRVRDMLSILFIPAGLIAYMIYLYFRNGDPLYFFHIQPLFGANRSINIILLPQVLWRYGKILFMVFLQPLSFTYFISVIELFLTLLGYVVLYWGIKMKERWSYLVYGIAAITLPTLTGTFSSMPRYLLNVFPLFFILGELNNKTVKYILLCIFTALQVILSAMFLRGWFVA